MNFSAQNDVFRTMTDTRHAVTALLNDVSAYSSYLEPVVPEIALDRSQQNRVLDFRKFCMVASPYFVQAYYYRPILENWGAAKIRLPLPFDAPHWRWTRYLHKPSLDHAQVLGRKRPLPQFVVGALIDSSGYECLSPDASKRARAEGNKWVRDRAREMGWTLSRHWRAEFGGEWDAIRWEGKSGRGSASLHDDLWERIEVLTEYATQNGILR